MTDLFRSSVYNHAPAIHVAYIYLVYSFGSICGRTYDAKLEYQHGGV
jgi:hypothetical protein